MKAVCVSCFNYYDIRVKHIENYLYQKGYEVNYITSDFDHISKKKFRINKPNVTQIQEKPYYKNLSVQRLYSHYHFAKDTIREVEKIKPDLLYVILPPNYLTRLVSKYKKANDVKLIYDVYDMWPEAFPLEGVKKPLEIPFKLWRALRDNHLATADVVFTECDLYREKLEHLLAGVDTDTLYLTKEKLLYENTVSISEDAVEICYLGSINNIIDIPSIDRVLSEINKLKPVTLHIIGDGETREHFIKVLQNSNIRVVYHGKIYDERKKREIFDKCQFGINMMKSSVCVGLTMKSIDYFQAGLPILNNIKADTTQIVEANGIGYNVTSENVEDIALEIVNLDIRELLAMRDRTSQIFDKFFSMEAFNSKLDDVLKGVLSK